MARILIVESDKLIAANTQRFLQRRGHKVAISRDPQGAIDSADKLRPDVIILDLVLGPHNGVEFLYELRSYPEWLTIPVIIHSGLSPEDLAGTEEALANLTIAAYHYKPRTTLAQLAESIDKLAVTTR